MWQSVIIMNIHHLSLRYTNATMSESYVGTDYCQDIRTEITVFSQELTCPCFTRITQLGTHVSSFYLFYTFVYRIMCLRQIAVALRAYGTEGKVRC